VRREGERRIVEIRHEGGAEELAGDAVLAALGRVANSDGLDGVELDARGSSAWARIFKEVFRASTRRAT
jgi:pyruvate/2-oxoglutarate dehydrogenase complex dihydrolipoamide dehydrogenase (E3) component